MGKRFTPGRSSFRKKNKPVEIGSVTKKGKSLIKTALVYPNTYRTGMSSLGFQTVYKLANQIEDVSCERVFLPDAGENKSPVSIETGLDLARFDIILFSISFENDFIHLVQLLGEAGIPLRSPDRNHIHPLVVAGGVACFLNPEPISPFIDVFLLGEAECLLAPFINLFIKKQDKTSFVTCLETKLEGAYVPSLHTSNEPFNIKVQFLDDLDDLITHSSILTSDTAFKNLFLIETLKGCPHGCRFCSAGFIYRPPRIYPQNNIIKAIDKAKTKTDKIGLVSSAIADHPAINQVCQYGLDQNLRLSFSSLRADKLSDELINALSQSKTKTATIAPEAGSVRMRNVINKRIDEADILTAVQQLVKAGIINLRLYFMIGLPFEKDDDIYSIVKLTKKIKETYLAESRKQKKIGTITLSINPFIPKPSTPFQWAPMAKQNKLKKRVQIIKNGLKKTANVRVNIESLKQAKIHALLSRGERKTADIIEAATKKGWAAAIREDKDYCDRIIYQEISPNKTLPWDFIDNSIKKDFLLKEYEKAKSGQKSAPCPMIDCDQCKTCMKSAE